MVKEVNPFLSFSGQHAGPSKKLKTSNEDAKDDSDSDCEQPEKKASQNLGKKKRITLGNPEIFLSKGFGV